MRMESMSLASSPSKFTTVYFTLMGGKLHKEKVAVKVQSISYFRSSFPIAELLCTRCPYCGGSLGRICPGQQGEIYECIGISCLLQNLN